MHLLSRCSCRKSISFKYSECVFVDFVIQQSKRKFRIVLYLWLFPLYPILVRYFINGLFAEKNWTDCGLLEFLYKVCLKHYPFKNNWRYIMRNVFAFNTRYACQFLKKPNFLADVRGIIKQFISDFRFVR